MEFTKENFNDFVCAKVPVIVKKTLHNIKRNSRLTNTQAKKLLITKGEGFTENKYCPKIISSMGNSIIAAKE
jgi:hypothetical protein